MTRLTPAGNPAGYFSAFQYSTVDAVFDAVGDLPPGKIAIRGRNGRMQKVTRSYALVWELNKIRQHSTINTQANSDLSPAGLRLKFHAIVSAADELLQKLGATPQSPRHGLSEQVREGLKFSAEHDPSAYDFLGDPAEHDAEQQVHDAIGGIFRIRRWAAEAERLTQDAVGKKAAPAAVDLLAGAGMEKGGQFDICVEIF